MKSVGYFLNRNTGSRLYLSNCGITSLYLKWEFNNLRCKDDVPLIGYYTYKESIIVISTNCSCPKEALDVITLTVLKNKLKVE